jgi:MoaA/NifB/PqqE/SkfB family radical SAM enzyme
MIIRKEAFGRLLFDRKTLKTSVLDDQIAYSTISSFKQSYCKLPILSAPLKLFLEITNNCNLHCIFCSNNSGARKKEQLSLKQIETVIKAAREMGVFEIGIIGGEPLCHHDFFEIVRCIKKYDFPIYLNTNAFFNHQTLKAFSTSGIDKIKVSIDGLKENHESIRGYGTFDKTVSNTRYLLSAGNDVQINFTVNKTNEKDIEGVIELANELNCPLKIAPMILVGRAKEIVETAVTDVSWSNINERISLYIQATKPRNKIEIASGFISDCENVISDYCFLYSECGLRGSFLSVNCFGDVFNTGKQTEFDDEHRAGNINVSSLQEIWENANKNNTTFFNRCGKCLQKDLESLYKNSFGETNREQRQL